MSITLEHRPTSGWSPTVVALKSKLEEKYGTPNAAEGGIPTSCRSEAQFQNCVESRAVTLRYAWHWRMGETLELVVGKPEQNSTAAVRLIYRPAPHAVSAAAL